MDQHKIPIWKRSLDLVVGSPCLMLAAPLMLVIVLCVRVSLGSPILFRQMRPGLGDQLFVLYKFRSMRIGDAREVTTMNAESRD